MISSLPNQGWCQTSSVFLEFSYVVLLDRFWVFLEHEDMGKDRAKSNASTTCINYKFRVGAEARQWGQAFRVGFLSEKNLTNDI